MDSNKKRIVVVGAGYVGMSISAMLSAKNEVLVVDIDETRVNSINNKISTVKDVGIEESLKNNQLDISATIDYASAYDGAEYIIIATPTNYDVNTKYFDTSIVEKVIKDILSVNKSALIIIKSTIPIGFTDKVIKDNNSTNIVFSPEFLREGRALSDNLLPSRIIFGGHKSEKLKSFAKIVLESTSAKDSIDILYMNSREAESVKLFSNSYLALRVAFFNEIDSFGIYNNLSSEKIINGVSLDNRIGNFYNNPSFGYGGYCLPKDTKQLLTNFDNIPQEIITAIVNSNETRKNFIVDDILKRKPKIVGAYRINMKAGSDNFRNASIIDVIKKLNAFDIEVLIYEPLIKSDYYQNFKLVHDLDAFKSQVDLIVTNRTDDELNDVYSKIYTRDVFNKD